MVFMTTSGCKETGNYQVTINGIKLAEEVKGNKRNGLWEARVIGAKHFYRLGYSADTIVRQTCHKPGRDKDCYDEWPISEYYIES